MKKIVVKIQPSHASNLLMKMFGVVLSYFLLGKIFSSYFIEYIVDFCHTRNECLLLEQKME